MHIGTAFLSEMYVLNISFEKRGGSYNEKNISA